MTNKLPVKCPLCGIEMQVVTNRDLFDGWYTSKYCCPQCGISTYPGKSCGRKQDAEDSALMAAFHRAKPGERYGDGAEDAQTETSLIAELLKKVKAIEDEHPYRIAGHYDTYSDYNQGWEDACTRIEEMLEARLEK